MSSKPLSSARSAEKTAIVPTKSNSVTPVPSQEDKLDASLNKLQTAYDGSLSHASTLIDGMIEIGRCVVDVVQTFVPPGKKEKTPKQKWNLLEAGQRVPFGWVQALRYKKIFDKKDELKKKWDELGSSALGSLTVETAYRLLGEPRPTQSDGAVAPAKAPAFLTGTVLGVSSQPLISRKQQLIAEIKTSEEEANRATQKLEQLKKLEAAYDFVGSFLAKPTILEKFPRPAKDWIQAFSLAAKDNKEVAMCYKILQVGEQIPAGDSLTKRSHDEYRNWVMKTYSDAPPTMLKKFEQFAYNPAATLASDSDFLKYLATRQAEIEAKKAEVAAQKKEFREKEKSYIAEVRKEFRKNNPRKPARAA